MSESQQAFTPPASLTSLAVLAVDCQTSGASPAYGDLLEIGFGVTSGSLEILPAIANWTTPATTRPVPRPIRKIIGWDETALETSIDPLVAWNRMIEIARQEMRTEHAASDVANESTRELGAIPCVIHFARFELSFLRDLHAKSEHASHPFPLDVVCLHDIAIRLFPTLPRRNLRALAGHLGGSPATIRRAKGHVEATAIVWRRIVPMLAENGITTWDGLKLWLETPMPSARTSPSAREFPLPAARRKSLPDVPGVYRFLRPSGDVLYVGKAASLKKRVASHFTAATGARATPRALEMLSQAHEIDVTPVATALEAALLEADEIKRLDPPYNVHLRTADRFAWFALRDWSNATQKVDDEHPVGPLPSRFALSGITAILALLLRVDENDKTETTARLRGDAVGVPSSMAPDAALFDLVWSDFAKTELAGSRSPRARILAAAKRIVVSEKIILESEDGSPIEPPPGWDALTIKRYLERVVVTEGALVRRARLLALLTDAHVIFREPGSAVPRLLVLAGGEITARRDFVVDAETPLKAAPPSLRTRLAGFDASRYDRLRVLATELRRVATQGGDATIRIGKHVLFVRSIS